MKTKEELIKYYEKQLEKVVSSYKDSHKGEEYIGYAEEQLEAVKNGRQW
ncbi:MAG: hypothetical protein ABS939_15310 [Psychrobacillus sp.]